MFCRVSFLTPAAVTAALLVAFTESLEASLLLPLDSPNAIQIEMHPGKS